MRQWCLIPARLFMCVSDGHMPSHKPGIKHTHKQTDLKSFLTWFLNHFRHLADWDLIVKITHLAVLFNGLSSVVALRCFQDLAMQSLQTCVKDWVILKSSLNSSVVLQQDDTIATNQFTSWNSFPPRYSTVDTLMGWARNRTTFWVSCFQFSPVKIEN